MENHSKTGVMVAALVVGALIGGISGYAIKGGMQSDDKNSDSSMMTSEGDGTTVGGALMVKDKDIVDNASAAENVSTTVSLVQMADLVETLKSEGPFTVFGPNNDAFAKLPAETVADLQKPENKATLASILTYHVVAGTYTSADLKVMAQKGETLETVNGATLTPIMEDNMVKLMDVAGNKVEIETADIISSNGVTHVIKSVLMPTEG